MYDVLRADRCISVNSIEARVPFGDLEFVRYVMAIDPRRKMNTYKMGKYLLRRAFEGDWLPLSILYRDKAAFSDAVGHSMVEDLKAFAEARYTDAEFAAGAAKYDFATPFTKESLLYRDLFESFYPGQARMVDDFWMPNRRWAAAMSTTPPPACWPTTAPAACDARPRRIGHSLSAQNVVCPRAGIPIKAHYACAFMGYLRLMSGYCPIKKCIFIHIMHLTGGPSSISL
jgi:hypothetical protein